MSASAPEEALRTHEMLEKTVRVRACDALRHSCESMSELYAVVNAVGDSEADGGQTSETIAGRRSSASGAAPDNCAAISVRLDAQTIAGIAALVPLVLDLAGTMEGARCLRAMVAAESGVGEAVHAAILEQDHLADVTSEAIVGVRAIVRMLVRFVDVWGSHNILGWFMSGIAVFHLVPP